jgi:hypothetical protein
LPAIAEPRRVDPQAEFVDQAYSAQS